MTDHLDESAWEKLAMRELDADTRGAALAHITSCPHCAKIYKGVLALERGARQFDPGVPAATPSTRRRWFAAGAIVAAAAAVIALWLVRPRNSEPVLRGGRQLVEVVSPAGPTPLPVQFAWQPIADADLYRLELLTETGESVWSATATQSPQSVPTTVAISRARFARVTALAGNHTIATSRLISFTIR